MDAQQKKEIEKEIVIAQLEATSSNLGFFEGGETSGAYSRDDLIDLIRNNDPIGLAYVDSRFAFIRDVASGALQKKIMEIEQDYAKDPTGNKSRS